MTSKTGVVLFVTGVSCAAVAASAILLSARVLGPLPVSVTQVTTQKDSSFNVSGESEITVVPDNAQISLGIEVTKPRVAEAQLQVNQVMNDLTTKLKAMGIDAKDIKTQNYSVSPNYDFTSGRQVTNGYIVNSSLVVNVKQFDKINEIIDMATAAGVTQVGNVNFKLSDEKEEEVKKQAREEAIVKAKKNAEELSGLAGMRLGRIINIAEGQTAQPPIYAESLRVMNDAAQGLEQKTNIEAGSSIYRYSVTLSYETL